MSYNWASLNILPDGNLEISLSEKDRSEIDWEDLYRNGSDAALWELLEGEMGNGWAEVRPEWIGALTEAPTITNDIEYEMDTHEPHPKMAVTIADALRAYSEVLVKDAATYAKHAAHTSLAEETKQRAEKLVKLADAIMDAF